TPSIGRGKGRRRIGVTRKPRINESLESASTPSRKSTKRNYPFRGQTAGVGQSAMERRPASLTGSTEGPLHSSHPLPVHYAHNGSIKGGGVASPYSSTHTQSSPSTRDFSSPSISGIAQSTSYTVLTPVLQAAHFMNGGGYDFATRAETNDYSGAFSPLFDASTTG
ncbi:hypothetical protein PMAYCL1PPCAC_28294, partial [Pristionchus mayeri]